MNEKPFYFVELSDIKLMRAAIEGRTDKSTLAAADLRNPSNIKAKRKIFKIFGLDADKGYSGNLS